MIKLLENTDGVTIFAECHDKNGKKYYHILDEAKNEISFATNNRSIMTNFKEFLAAHPILVGAAVSVGMSALDSYKANKRVTTRFFAQNNIERQMYQEMVDHLMKSGNYQLLKNRKRVHNGWLWELKRKGV